MSIFWYEKKRFAIFVVGALCLTGSCTMDAWEPYDGASVFVSSGTPTDYTVAEFLKICKEEFGVDVGSTLQPVIDFTHLDRMVVRFVPNQP